MKKKSLFLPLMAMILMAGLIICLFAACTKEEEVYNIRAQVDKSLSQVTYEANWIVNRQVVDQTKISFERSMSTNDHGNGGIQVEHMPNDILQVKNLLTDELAKPSAEDVFSFESQPFGDDSPYYYYSVELGFSEKNTYIANKNASEHSYGVIFGYSSWKVTLDCEAEVTYEQDTDQLILKMTVSKVSVQSRDYADTRTATHTFEPALTLLLVSTKRLH
jgi:hypothetical protein